MSQELFDRAIQLEEAGQLEEALVLWRELAASSQTRNAFLRLGGCAKELRRLNEAEQAFKRAVEIDARSALALTSLGLLAMNRGDYESAKGYLERALAIKEHPIILTLLGSTMSSGILVPRKPRRCFRRGRVPPQKSDRVVAR